MPRLNWRGWRTGLVREDPASTEEEALEAGPGALSEALNVRIHPKGYVIGRRGQLKQHVTARTMPIAAVHRWYPRSDRVEDGPRRTTSHSSVPGGGADWNNLGDLDASTGPTEFTVVASGSTTDELRGVVAGFTGVVDPVTGICVEVYARADKPARLTGANLLGVTGVVGKAPSIPLTTDYQLIKVGSEEDTWGTSPVVPASEVNDPAFGATVTFTADDDNVKIEVVVLQIRVFYKAVNNPPKTLVIEADSANMDMYTLDGGVFTAVDGVAAEIDSLDVQFAKPTVVAWPEQDRSYVFSGAAAALIEYDGRAAEFVYQNPDGLPPRRGPVATLWQGRLVATEPSEPFSVYFSGVNDPTRWLGKWHLAVNDPGAGQVTGLVGLDDRLLILKDTGAFLFAGDVELGGQLAKVSDIGCISRRSVVSTPYGAMFVGRDGVYLSTPDRPAPERISDAISPLFRGRLMQSLHRDAIGQWVSKLDAYVVRLDLGTQVAYVAQRVPGREGWHFAWTQFTNFAPSAMTTFEGVGDSGEWYTGSTTGFVREADVGSDDDGTPIAIAVSTASLPLTQNLEEFRATHLLAEARSGKALPCELVYDRTALGAGVSVTLGEAVGVSAFQVPRAFVADTATFGRRVRVRVTNPTDGPAFELHQVGLEVDRRTFKRWR